MGMCRAKHLREKLARKRVAEEEENETKRRRVEHVQFLEADEPQPIAALSVAATLTPVDLNQTDLAWLKLYTERKDISSSIMDDVLPLCAMPDETHFTSAAGFFTFVDSLPGPAFEVCRIPLPMVPEQIFDFAHRPMVSLVQDFATRFNGSFLDPAEDTPETTERLPEFVDGDRFRMLQKALQDAAGPEAVLMPLIFSSGTQVVGL